MPGTFFASDHHLGHQGIITFLRNDGVTKVREFVDVDVMNEHIIAQHNSVVGERDTCWFLGDVVINRRYLELIKRFNGRKRLVMGNHDIFKNKDYLKAGFEDLHAFRKFDGFVATHVPVHSESIRASWGINVHGHLHTNRVMRPGFRQWVKQEDRSIGDMNWQTDVFKADYSPEIDSRYYCVCVEQLDDYKPISIDDLRKKIC